MGITAAKLFVMVGGDTTDLDKKLAGSSKKLDDFGKSAQNVGKKMTTYVTLPLLGVGVAATKLATDFDANLSVLQATSKATGTEMDALRKKAFDLGRDMTLPGTSAADAADAMLELSKAGLSVNNVLDASKGVLQLSAAGQLSNARAAEIAANALNAFHLQGSQATEVADLLAAAANASSGEVTDMADSLQMAAAVAYSAGIPIEDLVAAISEMSNAGIQGSDAGTSLKQMILSLEAPTTKAAKLIRKLGISLYDTEGNMLPLVSIIGQFQDKLGPLTQAQRNQALATIFGSDAIRAANIVLMGGVDAFGNMKDAVTESGAAADLANAQMKGLKGAFENIRNAAETAMLAGIQPFKGDIEDLGKKVANAVDSFNNLDEAQQKQIVEWGLLIAGIGPTIWLLGGVARVAGTVITVFAVIPGLITGITTAFTAWRAGMTLTTALGAAGLGPMAITLGAIALAVGSIVGVWMAWNKEISKTNEEGAKAVQGTWEKFFSDQVASGADATEILNAYNAAQQRVQDALDNTNPVLRLFVQNQDQLKGDLTGLNFALFRSADSYDEYTRLARQAGIIAGLFTEEQFKMRDSVGQAGAEVDATTQALAGMNQEMAAANPLAMSASDIMSTFSSALQDAQWNTQAADQASANLAVTLGQVSAAQAQANQDVQLVAGAFAAGAIGADQLNTYMLAAKDGTLELSDAQREQYQSAVDAAAALRDNAKAGNEAAKANLALEQSLKGASQAQIAQAAINSLNTALDDGAIALPDYITAVSGIQDTFGLADDKSRALADGISGLIGGMQTGILPAQDFDKALQDLITDAGDGKVDIDELLEKFRSQTPEAMAIASGAFNDSKLKMMEMGAEATTQAGAVSDAFTGEDWAGVGGAVGDGLIQGLTDKTPAIEAAARLAARRAIQAAEDELGVQSPSKEGARLGKLFDIGVAQGLMEGLPLLQGAVSAAMPAMASSVTYSTYSPQVSVQATLNRELDMYTLARDIAKEIKANKLL